MARRSARWDRAYGRGDDPFGEVQLFLDRMAADRMAGQKMDLFRRLALEAFDELERRSVLSTMAGIGEPKGENSMRRHHRSFSGAPRPAPSSGAANGTRDDQRIKGEINRAGVRIS